MINFIIEAMKNWAVELTASVKTLAKVINPEKHFQSMFPLYTTICNGKDATQLHT